MAYSKLEKLVLDGATPIAAEVGCYIYDVEYVKEGGARYLRIYADKKEGGISLDECEVINRAMCEFMDEKDPIKENYILEVSSPGVERKLRTPEHFEQYMGRTVDVGLYKAIDGSKTVTGELMGFADEKVVIAMSDNELELPLSETTFVKLHFDF